MSQSPSEIIQPFLNALSDRRQEIDQKINTRNTTPEDHGEKYAINVVTHELSARTRIQEKNNSENTWQVHYLAELREDLGIDHEGIRKYEAAKRQMRLFANELERIWKEAGVIQ